MRSSRRKEGHEAVMIIEYHYGASPASGAAHPEHGDESLEGRGFIQVVEKGGVDHPGEPGFDGCLKEFAHDSAGVLGSEIPRHNEPGEALGPGAATGPTNQFARDPAAAGALVRAGAVPGRRGSGGLSGGLDSPPTFEESIHIWRCIWPS
jgi:hypothetical protein